MNNTPSLLPCPFCGAVPHLKRSTRGDYTSIVCHGECSGPLVIVIPNDLIEAGIAAWNRRTPQPVVREPLTQGQIESLLWTYGYDPDDDRMAAMLQAARGITQKGGSNA